MDDQSLTEIANRTTQNNHEKKTSMLSAGFEIPDPSNELLQTDTLDRKVTRIVNKINIRYDNECIRHSNGDTWVIHRDTFQF